MHPRVTLQWLYRQSRFMEPKKRLGFVMILDNADDPLMVVRSLTQCEDCRLPRNYCTELCQCAECHTKHPLTQLRLQFKDN
jgi:hypothetical protein